MAVLALSAAMLIFVAFRAAAALAPSRPDRFWIFIAVISLQLGGTILACSLIHRLEPMTFLGFQALIAAGAFFITRGRGRRLPRPDDGGDFRALLRDWPSVLMLLAIVALLALAATLQAITPIAGWDELGYHAPRIAYWLEYRTTLLPESHDYRQSTFPYGAELLSGWTLLFFKAEWPMRLAFWTQYPAATAGIYLLCRAIGLGRRASLGGALLYAATPTVLWHASLTLKSDAWLPLYCAGTAYFALRPRATDERPGVRYLFAGVFLALACNVKTTALALGPGLALVALLELRPRTIARAVGGLTLGFLGAALLSGLVAIMVQNAARYKHPMGPAVILHFVKPQFSPHQLAVHAIRTPLYLAEAPEIPAEPARAWLERAGNRLADRLGVTAKLEYEGNPWPGAFRFNAPPVATCFSLGGILWIPALLAGLFTAAVGLIKTRRPIFPAPALLAIIQLPLFLGVILLIRWMGGGPQRFWLGAFALAIPVIARIGERAAARPIGAALAALALIITCHATFRGGLFNLAESISRPRAAASLDAPFAEPITLIPPDARILFFATGQTREWGLLRPRDGFTTRVYPWGMGDFDPKEIQAQIEARGISAILVESEANAAYRWQGPMSQALMRWLSTLPGFHEVPLKTPLMRLFLAGPSPSQSPAPAIPAPAAAGPGGK